MSCVASSWSSSATFLNMSLIVFVFRGPIAALAVSVVR